MKYQWIRTLNWLEPLESANGWSYFVVDHGSGR
jgi:hypothetical protein